MNSSRNIYRQGRVDFAQLAEVDREFAQCVKANRQVDFNDPDAVRQLTKSLLKRDFNLDIELPADRLCPPVPNRLNYILWIQDLLDETSHDLIEGYDHDRKVRGLDIGTGASCIYPLLGCSTRSTWDFVATELDETNYEWAQANISRNNLDARISLIKRASSNEALLAGVLEGDDLDFTMCNPPFYTSEAELLHLAGLKARPPFSACTGAPIEMICAGGELSFIKRIINESMLDENKRRIQWFTSMCGKWESVGRVLEILKNKGCENVAVREFVNQAYAGDEEEEGGQRAAGKNQKIGTKRWGVAWSWMSLRPGMDTARNNISSKIPKHLLPFPSEYIFTHAPADSEQQCHNLQANKRAKVLNSSDLTEPGSTRTPPLEEIFARLKETLEPLDMQLRWKSDDQEKISVIGWCNGDVWSRKARRAKKRSDVNEGIGKAEDIAQLSPRDAKFGVKVVASLTAGENSGEGVQEETEGSEGSRKRNLEETQEGQHKKLEMRIRYLKGADGVLFESFCGMIKRKIEHN